VKILEKYDLLKKSEPKPLENKIYPDNITISEFLFELMNNVGELLNKLQDYNEIQL